MSTPLRVLMIEDSEDDALLMFRTLNKGGYDPVYERVETAAAMKDALQNKSWDIILCDYKLPVFSGLKAIALLKELNIDIPFIIVSGTIGEETAVECMRLGAHDYVMKNNLSRLVPAIARELAEVKSRIERRRAEQAVVTSELRLKELFEHMSNCVAVYEAREDGTDFIIKDFNRAAEIAEKIDREKVIGKSILEVFPGAREMELFAVLQRVWKTGRPEQLRASYYRDDRIQGWRENYVYKLQTGEVVALYNDITERKQAERKIFESEEKYRLLVENSSEAILIVQDNMVKFVNRAAVQLFDSSYEVLVSTPFTEFIYPDDRELVMSVQLKQLKGEKVPASYNFRVITASRAVLWVESHSTIVPWQGKPATLDFFTDITARKRVEEKLRKSEQQQRIIIENMTDTVQVMDMNLRTTWISPSVTKVSGFTLEELTQIPLEKLLVPESFQRAQKLILEHLTAENLADKNKEITINVEFEYYWKNGDTGGTEMNISLLRDATGKPTGFLGVGRDITKYRQMEQTLQESQKQLQNAYKIAKIGSWIWDLNSKTIIWSEEFSRIAGLDLQTNVFPEKKHPRIYTQESWNRLKKAVSVALKTGKPYQLELEAVRPDGNNRWFNCIGDIMYDRKGRIAGLHGTAQDITERKRAELELRHFSIHDVLTGLYNRGYFEETMARLERGRQFPISILMADVDGLKETNDRKGHAAGDELLRRIAQVLNVAFREEDIIARIGGDEFAVILPNTDATAVENALHRFRHILQEHNNGNAGCPVRLSFGVSTAEQCTTLKNVLAEADENMYRNKRGHDVSGKNHG